MKPPCESVVKAYLRTLRGLVMRQLRDDHDFKQEDIATALELTQAAISQNLNREFPRRGLETELVDLVEDTARGITALIVANRDALESIAYQHEVLRRTCLFCKELRLVGGFACGLHKREVPYLATHDCKVCSQFQPALQAQVSDRERVLHELAAAGQKLEALPGFAALIPEVQANLLLRGSRAQGIEDIAAFPGRIVRVRDETRVIAEPEFGASSHVSRIFLAVFETTPAHRCCVCLRYDPRVDVILATSDLRVVKVALSEQLHGKSQDLQTRLQAYLREQAPGELDVLVNEGTHGMEPITYLFAPSVAVLLERIKMLVAQYQAPARAGT